MYLWVQDQYSWMTLARPHLGTLTTEIQAIPSFALSHQPLQPPPWFAPSWASVQMGGEVMPASTRGSFCVKLSFSCTRGDVGAQWVKNGRESTGDGEGTDSEIQQDSKGPSRRNSPLKKSYSPACFKELPWPVILPVERGEDAVDWGHTSPGKWLWFLLSWQTLALPEHVLGCITRPHARDQAFSLKFKRCVHLSTK